MEQVPHSGGVVEVEVYPISFIWTMRGRGGVEVRYSIYVLQPLPCFGVVVEVEVDPSNFNWRRWGRGVLEVRYNIYLL